jgi:hypothetical protein
VVEAFACLGETYGTPVALAALASLPSSDRLGAALVFRCLTERMPSCDEDAQTVEAVWAGVRSLDADALQSAERLVREGGRGTVARACVDAIVKQVPLKGAWRRVPFLALWPLRDLFKASLWEHHPDVMRALEAKAYNAEDSRHTHVGALAWLSKPHALKFLSGDSTFDYNACVKLSRSDRVVPPLGGGATAEAWYLAYETTLVYDQVIAPALARVKELRRHGIDMPVMLVANVSYGGSAATSLPLRDLEKQGVRVVFTKVGSSAAHGEPNVLIPGLFTAETEAFLAQRRPLVIVLDGGCGHYPDGLRGFRNYASLLNQTAPFPAPAAWQQGGLDARPFVPKPEHEDLKNRLQELQRGVLDGPAASFEVFYTSLTHDLLRTEFGEGEPEEPAPFDLSQVHGPAFLLVQTAMPHADITRRALAGEVRARELLLRPEVEARMHTAIAFDDSEWQRVIAFLGRQGPKAKSQLHRTTRDAFKVLMPLPSLPALPRIGAKR